MTCNQGTGIFKSSLHNSDVQHKKFQSRKQLWPLYHRTKVNWGFIRDGENERQESGLRTLKMQSYSF